MLLRNAKQFLVLGAFVLFGLPFTSVPAQSNTDDQVKVIQLSPSGYEQGVSIAFSPDGDQIAVGGSSGVYLFNFNSLSRESFIETESWARSIVYAPDGQSLFAGLFDGSVRQWQLSSEKQLQVFENHVGWVRSVVISNDGNILATVGDDQSIHLWDLQKGTLKLTINDLAGPRVLALSPDGEILAVGLQDAHILLLQVSDGSIIKTLSGHTDWVRSLAFSPDGKKLASGAFDATARIWDVESGQTDFVLSDHQSSVLGLDFSPDGTMLATGSVDTTVKLWNVYDGSLLRTLIGHADFVYAVAFSPDGHSLASTSSDNTARVWVLDAPQPQNLHEPSTPSDCRLCHHPRGLNAPPRVIQISCEACHANGIGMNWCPFFPRSSQAVSPIASSPLLGPVGVPVVAENVAVYINYPTNGETLYSNGKNLSPAFVKGHVFSNGETEIAVQLEIWSDETLAGMLLTKPDQDGNFTFKIALNPDGSLIVAGAKAADPDCSSCHEDFESQAFFPDGQVHFVVTAVTSSGEKAQDERWITVDTSGSAELDVLVLDEETGSPIPHLPVHASTILYEWRDRYSNQVTNMEGIAQLSLEALSQSATQYEISIPPSALGGYLYESVEPVQLELAPGVTSHAPITIHVHKMRGQISGEISGAQLSEPLDVWAVHLPDGTFQKTSIENNAFAFDELPSGKYQVFIDPAIEQLGYQVEALHIDLTKKAQASVNLNLVETKLSRVIGNVRDENGNSLPFGWITTASGQTVVLNPTSGMYTLSKQDSAKTTLTLDVPGYYSQARVAEKSTSALDFDLVMRPETQIQAWGNGEIILPPETDFEENSAGITLNSGWIWGQNETADALLLQVADIQIKLMRGTFAVEYSPSQGGWIYVSDGEAILQTNDGQEVSVANGQMAALSEQFAPIAVPFEEAVFLNLNSQVESALPHKWEPSLEAQIRDRLARIGINIAQFVTFVTYSLVLIVIATFSIRAIYSTWKRVKTTNH